MIKKLCFGKALGVRLIYWPWCARRPGFHSNRDIPCTSQLKAADVALLLGQPARRSAVACFLLT
jgi:hypothetical protein